MAGIYGEFLGYFSELRKVYPLYERENELNNLSLKEKGTVCGIVQNKNTHLFDKGVNRKSGQYSFWTEEKLDITKDCLLIREDMYAVIKEEYYNAEGGFCSYLLERIQGARGQESEEISQGGY